MNKFIGDTELQNMFQQEVEIPSEVAKQFRMLPETVAITAMRGKMRTQRRGVKAMMSIAAVMGVVVLSATAVFLHSILFQKHKALDTAQQNGLMQEVDTSVAVNPGVRTRVESVMMDAHNLVIVFEHAFDQNITLPANNTSRLENMVIRNGNGVIIASNAATMESLTTSEGDTFEAIDEKTIRHALILTGDYPKSEELIITFDGIAFEGSLANMPGTWSFTVPVQALPASEQTIAYTADSPYADAAVTSVVLAPMSMEVTMEFQRALAKHVPYWPTLTDNNGEQFFTEEAEVQTIERDGKTISIVTFQIAMSSFEGAESYVMELIGADAEEGNNYEFLLQKSAN